MVHALLRVALAHGHSRAVFVDQARQALRDPLAQGVGFAARDDASALAALQIEIDARQAETVRLGAAPVDVSQVALVPGVGLHREIAFPREPGIQVDAALERLEPVVGQDEEHGLLVDVPHRLAHDAIHADIELLQRVRVAAPPVAVRAVGRMVGFQVPVEHVLDSVRRVEHARDHAFAGAFEGRLEHRLALRADLLGLLQERLFVDDPFVQGPGVLRQAERGEIAEQLRQVRRVERGMGDRKRRLFRVDGDGRQVQADFRFDGGEAELRDSGHLDAQARPERQADPGGVAVWADLVRLAFDFEAAPVPAGIEPQPERQQELAGAGPDAVRRTANLSGVPGPFPAQGIAGPGLLELRPRRPCREQLETALRAEQVRRAHRREQPPLKRFRRKRDRHPQNRRTDEVLAQQGPERLALAPHFDLGLGERDAPRAEFPDPRGLPHPRRG